jgi:hypothetical protein
MGEVRLSRQHPGRLPLAKQVDVGKMLENMQQRGVIEKSDSSCHPPSFSSGRTGTWRFCVYHKEELFPTVPD